MVLDDDAANFLLPKLKEDPQVGDVRALEC